jgi:glycogen debranching enzyme
MISLPGLTLATGRPQIARRILATFASFVSQGMLPNVFPGAGERADYNTADASLWFFEAWRAYATPQEPARSARADRFPVAKDFDSPHRRL